MYRVRGSAWPFARERVDLPLDGWCQTVPSEGNPRLILRLDPLIRSGLQAQAMSKGVSLNELAKFVLVEYVKQSAEAKEGTPALSEMAWSEI